MKNTLGYLIDDDALLDCPIEAIEMIVGPPDKKNTDEYMYVLRSYFFGLITKKIYLFIKTGLVKDYYIGI